MDSPVLYGVYGVAVRMIVCGAIGLGSNPNKLPHNDRKNMENYSRWKRGQFAKLLGRATDAEVRALYSPQKKGNL